MSDRNINRLFEALTPTTEQKEKILHRILEHSGNDRIRRRGFTALRRTKFAVVAAVIMLFLTTTAFAAKYIGLDESFLTFLHPVNNQQAEFLSNGAYAVNKKIVNKNGTLTIKQVIGDSNLTYILMDFTAPKGAVLNAARYRFESPSLSAGQDYSSPGFMLLEDENPNDNKISLVMSIMTRNTIAGQMAHLDLRNLEAADPYPGIFNTAVPGSWETSFKLDFNDYSTLYEPDQHITMFGYDAVLKTISVSPISITLKIESNSLKEINKATGKSKEIGKNEYLDDFPITINFRDGTSETTDIFTGLRMSEYTSGQMLTIKTFENVINDKEIASIVFFDKEIPIGN